MTKYFLSCEFINGPTIDLISIGIVEGDREYYAENLNVDLAKLRNWGKQKNDVVSALWSRQSDKSEFNRWSRDGGLGGLLSREEINRDVSIFCSPQTYGEPEFWASYAGYDYNPLCRLLGSLGLPKETAPNSIRREGDRLGNPKLPDRSGAPSNALAAARWNQAAWEFLHQFEESQRSLMAPDIKPNF